jgi:hypothetical protein
MPGQKKLGNWNAVFETDEGIGKQCGDAQCERISSGLLVLMTP